MNGNRLLYSGAILSIGFATLFTYASPLVLRSTIDSIIGDKPLTAPQILINLFTYLGGVTVLRQKLWYAGLLLVVIALFRGCFNYLTGRWSAAASESIALKLRNDLYARLQKVPVPFYFRFKTGDLVQRCTSDVETIRKFFGVQVVDVGKSLLMLLLVIPILFSLDVKMAFLSLAIIPAIITFAIIFFLKIKSKFTIADESEGSMSAMLQENLTGIRVVRAFAREDYEIAKFEEKNRLYRENVFNLIRILGIYWGLSDALIYFQTGLVLVAGIFRVIQGEITLGTLVAFMTYEEFLLWPIRAAGRTLTDLGKAFVSIGRISAILDAPLETDSGWSGGDSRIIGNIVFDKVTFAYKPGETVLKNISFTIKAGETVVIIGPTGSGKSTLVNLLPRLWEIAEGSILIDGREIRLYNRYYLREQIGIVLQEPFLYSKTLQDNILLGTTNIQNENKLIEASQIAAIHDEILTFEKGYNTLVGERGVTLSGGQKQRIAIARTILRNPPILIFDDSLSALDTKTETHIKNALSNRKGNATTIVITHRLNIAIDADHIIVLENGTITQQGTHAVLSESPGLYKRLWELQTAGVNINNPVSTQTGPEGSWPG